MADERLSDAELADELAKYGEIVQLPIKLNKRNILLKKLNHFRAKNSVQNGKQSSKSPSANSWNRFSTATRQGEKFPSNNTHTATPVHKSSDIRTLSFSKYASDSREQAFGTESQNSDDSDVEHASNKTSFHYSQPSYTNHGTNHVRGKRQTSQLSDNVLRSLRRRTVEPPPRIPVKSKSPQPPIEKNRPNNSLNDGSDGEIAVPSPARSRLYPELSKMTSFMSQSSYSDKFESSDSDVDSSSVYVENKSVNTSLPYSYQSDAELTGRSGNATPSPSTLNNSATYIRRAYPLRRNYANGHYRVQPYRSKYHEMLPQVLLAVAALFFVVLSVTYVVIQKDFFFSWFTSSINIGAGDHILRCPDNIPGNDCCVQDELDKSLLFTEKLFEKLSTLKGKAQCDTSRSSDVAVRVGVMKEWLSQEQEDKHQDVMRVYECTLRHIIANPHWQIRAETKDGSLATELKDVFKLQSEVADMSWLCRLRRSLSTVLYEICITVVVVAASILLLMYIRYRLRRRETEQKEVFALVEKIVDFLQMHYDQSKDEESSEQQYLAVQHVRDQLLPPAQRRKLQPIWDKAVEFIVANESRIRLETRLIHGEEFEVWHWLQPSLHNGKIWQGQAFGENSESKGSNQVIYSPTPCLKIRNMFDSNVENEDNWEDNVTDAILEKCEDIDNIVHIFVDVDSREGCVYLKCSSCEAAGRARLALHGWWFDGRLVTVKHLKTEHYHKRWPEARETTKPLKPSTNQMRSLSQPYYRSSLEMT